MKYGAIYADPPWRFEGWRPSHVLRPRGSDAQAHYPTMPTDEICALPVAPWAADDSVLFLWITWPQLPDAMRVIEAWGFKYKTCAFCWIKADDRQADLLGAPPKARMGLGYWTRSNSEVCLLATRGKPKRLNADVRQVILEPLREHSRKPDDIRQRIERLVAGPYMEMFARTTTPGWDVWGNETTKFAAA